MILKSVDRSPVLNRSAVYHAMADLYGARHVGGPRDGGLPDTEVWLDIAPPGEFAFSVGLAMDHSGVDVDGLPDQNERVAAAVRATIPARAPRIVAIEPDRGAFVDLPWGVTSDQIAAGWRDLSQLDETERVAPGRLVPRLVARIRSTTRLAVRRVLGLLGALAWALLGLEWAAKFEQGGRHGPARLARRLAIALGSIALAVSVWTVLARTLLAEVSWIGPARLVTGVALGVGLLVGTGLVRHLVGTVGSWRTFWAWLKRNQLRLAIVLPVLLVLDNLAVMVVEPPDPEDVEGYLLAMLLLAAWQTLYLGRFALLANRQRRRARNRRVGAVRR